MFYGQCFSFSCLSWSFLSICCSYISLLSCFFYVSLDILPTSKLPLCLHDGYLFYSTNTSVSEHIRRYFILVSGMINFVHSAYFASSHWNSCLCRQFILSCVHLLIYAMWRDTLIIISSSLFASALSNDVSVAMYLLNLFMTHYPHTPLNISLFLSLSLSLSLDLH